MARVYFAASADLVTALDEVVARFAGGSRSEFLRLAVHHYQGQLRLGRLGTLRGRASDERGGRRYSADEVLTMIRALP